MYLPADGRRNAKYFIKALKPAIAIFIKYEFWYNYLSELKKAGIPVIFVSAIFRRSQPFFRWYGSWFRGRLKSVDHFFVQDKHSAKLLESTGISNFSISGDTRFDRVADILQKKAGNPGIERFCEGHKVLLAGSTWPPDEAILSNIPQRFPDIKMIIAPHEVKDERITQLMKTMNTEVARFTKDDPADWPSMQVLIIDTIGILSSVYRYADIAYIGGAFATGLHNIQEPAVNGMPVIFGPKYQKFREAVELVELGGAFYVRNNEELQSILIKLLGDDGMFLTACETSRKYMQEQRGATRKIMEGLAQYLD
jgi:3-deoxy-D-manno-octulosonic-acid transferase